MTAHLTRTSSKRAATSGKRIATSSKHAATRNKHAATRNKHAATSSKHAATSSKHAATRNKHATTRKQAHSNQQQGDRNRRQPDSNRCQSRSNQWPSRSNHPQGRTNQCQPDRNRLPGGANRTTTATNHPQVRSNQLSSQDNHFPRQSTGSSHGALPVAQHATRRFYSRKDADTTGQHRTIPPRRRGLPRRHCGDVPGHRHKRSAQDTWRRHRHALRARHGPERQHHLGTEWHEEDACTPRSAPRQLHGTHLAHRARRTAEHAGAPAPAGTAGHSDHREVGGRVARYGASGGAICRPDAGFLAIEIPKCLDEKKNGAAPVSQCRPASSAPSRNRTENLLIKSQLL